MAIVVMLALMWLGWRNRSRRQSAIPAPPPPPAGLGEPLLVALSGMYVGSTFARQWQDRVVVHGLGQRASATATLYLSGVMIEREAVEPIFLPVAQLTGARLEPALAGKVMGEGGLLVLTWQLGDSEIDSGFRADDKSEYPLWVRTINERVAA
jgi:hypothetical protein